MHCRPALLASVLAAAPYALGCTLTSDLCELDIERCAGSGSGGTGSGGATTVATGSGGTSSGTGGGGSVCGDGFIGAGERCDDGNDVPDDGCTDCQVVCFAHEFEDPATGHCYAAIASDGEFGFNWGGARSSCVNDWGSELAAISSPEENTFFTAAPFDYDAYYWLGGHDSDGDGTYAWINGEPWGFFQGTAPPPPGQRIALVGGLFAVYSDETSVSNALCERPPPGSAP
jgi:cysteine-rich repeat protein